MKTNPIVSHLSKPAAKIVSGWLKDLPEDRDPRIRRAIARNIIHEIHRHKRASHQRIAFGYILSRVVQGERVDHIISSWHGSGSYLISIGVGVGFIHGKIARDEIGVHIRDRGIKAFKIRPMYAEAQRIVENRHAGTKSLF